MRRSVGAAVAVVLLAVGCSGDDGAGSGGGTDEPGDAGIRVEVLSSRPEHVTGGDAVVAVVDDGGGLDGVTVSRDGEDVTGLLAPDPDDPGRLVGVVEGLPDGESELVAERGDDRVALTLVNHDEQGPVFSGEPLELVSCTTETYGLAASTPDDGCYAEPEVTWEYVDTDDVRKPLADPEAVPADAQQIDVEGTEVPFVVRVETGVLNRSVYRIETVEGHWNQRLVYRFGGGCGTTFSQGFMGTGPAAAELLRRGYATATATFNTYQVLCNDVISAETASIVKEHFSETVGVPDFTIGEGGSGGAIQQILLAQNHPGLLDAIAPSVPFPDAFSISPGVYDCALLGRYYAAAGPGSGLTTEQQQAINGHATAGTCDLWARTFAQGIDPAAGCRLDLASAFAGAGGETGPAPAGIPEEAIYDADTNPDGLRCTVWETNVALVGRDPDTGFARSGYDNAGVQYGLDALNAGAITTAQFLDLNERIGGFDQDGQPQPERTDVDPELMATAYANGRVAGPWGGLPDTPIILVNVFTDELGDIHDRVRAFSLMDRLSAGSEDGEVPATVSLWTYGAEASSLIETLTGALADLTVQPTLVLDEWLTAAEAYRADHPDAEWREALAEAKPAAADSRCVVGEEEHVVAPDDPTCMDAYPVAEEPRMAAGGPRSGDVLKCQVVPVAAAVEAGQYEVELSDAEVDRLAAIFPDGVCDWSQPSTGFGPPDRVWPSF